MDPSTKRGHRAAGEGPHYFAGHRHPLLRRGDRSQQGSCRMPKVTWMLQDVLSCAPSCMGDWGGKLRAPEAYSILSALSAEPLAGL